MAETRTQPVWQYALKLCVNELIERRDALYGGGSFDHEDDRAEVLRLDGLIDISLMALGQAPRPEALPGTREDVARLLDAAMTDGAGDAS